MKNYKDSDYAANKYSPNIVYRFGNETVEITPEKFLADNPNMNEDDFLRFKALSDAIYLEQVQTEHFSNRKNVSLTVLEETEACATRPIDEYIEKQEEKAVLRAVQRFLDSDILTETQKRRFIEFYIQGLSERQIAIKENTSNVAIFKSINQSLKKIENFLRKWVNTPP